MKLFNFFKKLISKKNKKKAIKLEGKDISERESYVKELKISSSLEKNIKMIKELYGESFDLVFRKINIGEKKELGILIYMEGLTDTRSIEQILRILHIDMRKIENLSPKKENFYQTALKTLNNKDIDETEDLHSMLKKIAFGFSVIIFEGTAKAIMCETQEFMTRDIQEPEGEMVLRGPRDGFVENIEVNTSLLRRRLRTPHLWIQNMEIGKISKTNVAVAYIKGVVSEELVKEAKKRLEKIDIDNVLESGYLEEFIVDQPFTFFPLVQRTERPDKAISCLVEGKVAIITNGTPFVLIIPSSYNNLLQAPDDYYEPFIIGSFLRLLRHLAFLISFLLPGFYVAILNFHPELIPISLLLRIAATREGVPFPIIVEALIMESIFEVLREAGLRLPRAVGSAISIVGALILGEAAITAGLVSPAMVIIVALTAIASFTTPDYSLAIAARILRFIFLLLGATIGLFGIQFGLLLLVIHMSSLRSFGQPYFQPYGPLIWQDLKDSFFRLYWWGQKSRPKLMGGREPERVAKGQKPEPPDNQKGG